MLVKKVNFNIYSVLLCLSILFAFSCDGSKGKEVGVDSENINPEIQKLSDDIIKEPNNSKNYFERATLYSDQASYEQAIQDVNKAISIDSSQANYYHLLSDLYLDYYKSGAALDIMEKVALKFPNSIPSLLKLSELQLILKQYDASFFTVQKILNQDKQNAEAFFMLGMIYRAQGDAERAINSFQSAVELDPEIVDGWIILGDLFADKDFKIAEKYYDNAIRLDPENVRTYHAKAFYLQNNKRTEEAMALYRFIVTKDSKYSDAYLNLGILYLEKDSLEQALTNFNKMVEADSSSYLAFYYRGISKMFNNDKVGAKSDLEKALEIRPSFERAQQALESL